MEWWSYWRIYWQAEGLPRADEIFPTGGIPAEVYRFQMWWESLLISTSISNGKVSLRGYPFKLMVFNYLGAITIGYIMPNKEPCFLAPNDSETLKTLPMGQILFQDSGQCKSQYMIMLIYRREAKKSPFSANSCHSFGPRRPKFVRKPHEM